MIPYGRQEISEQDIQAVAEVLRSDYLTQGRAVPVFEAAVAAYCGAGFAVAMNSATSALHVACMALGVGPGDRVWTSPITFAASANCALYCGASVDYVDIDPRTYNMSVPALTARLRQAEQDGTLPSVVIPVHMTGQSCDMAAIQALAKQYGFRLIEDASHAIGGRYLDAPVGCGRFSDITVFSFHPVKIITTAEGGMAMTNDPQLARRMARLRTHGITREDAELTHPSEGPWFYQQLELGYNYRMTDVQAALGISQLKRIDEFVARRHGVARRYDDALAADPVVRPWQHPDTYSAWHLYVVRLQRERIGRSHREVFESMRADGIGVNLHYIPVYRHPYHAALLDAPPVCPEAERYYAEAISLPMYPGLAEADQAHVIAALRGGLYRVNIAVIPARGGSKRIPGKNVRDFCGRPMIAWSIETALASGLFAHVLVSTDDAQVQAVARACGAEVPFTRPAELSDDHATTIAVLAHATRWALGQGWPVTAVCCIYATAPLLEVDDVRAGLAALDSGPWDYAFTVTEFDAPVYRAFRGSPQGGVEMLFPQFATTRSQDLPDAWHDAAMCYWGRPSAWLEERPVFSAASRPVPIPRTRAQDIDTPEDWALAEALFQRRRADRARA